MAGDNVCHVCGATFTRPQHVGRHMRSHTGDKPYHCKDCPEKFARSDLLSRHVNKTHGPPEGEDGKGNGKVAMANKKKGRKPKFTSVAAALSSSSAQAYRPPLSIQPHQQPSVEQRQFPEGPQIPYHSQPQFHGPPFQQSQGYAFAQTELSPSGATISPVASSSATGLHMAVPPNQPNGMMYSVVGENGMASGFEVDHEEEDDDAWIDMPNDHNNMQMPTANSMPPYMMAQQYNPMAQSHSQIPLQMAQQHSSMSTPQYPQQVNNSFAVNNVPLAGHGDALMPPEFSASYSPGMMAMHNITLSNDTSDSSPYAFWSGSVPQSSPLRNAMPTYAQPVPDGNAFTVPGPMMTSSSSPYSFTESAFPRHKSDSPVINGVDITRTKGSSPLAPAPAGTMSLGPIPTTYSSVMPAPLVPTGTPLADKVDKVKKRACASCNQSKVKCDFQIPCGKCAARNISCIYPTGRKSSRKINTSSSPLSQSTNDSGKPSSTSPPSHTIDFQPMVAPTQHSALNESPGSLTSAGMAGNIQFQIPFPYHKGEAQASGNSHLEERQPPYNMEFTNPHAMQRRASDALTGQMSFAPEAFMQIRQMQEEDGQSTTSGYTLGHPSAPDSRRSSMATPAVPEDDQQISKTLPFNTLSLDGSSLRGHDGSSATDVHQWLANAAGVSSSSVVDLNSGGPKIDQSGYVIESPLTTVSPTYFWQNNPPEYSDTKTMTSFAPFNNSQMRPPDLPNYARPTLLRGRSNSFPSLYTKNVQLGQNREQSVLPHDWTAQMRHMHTQLNRNGSGASSLQQVDDTLDGTAQSSPQNDEHSPEGNPASSQPNNMGSFNPSRPRPAVIQSSTSNPMAKQLLTSRGSLQTLAPERTASFLNSTPSSELDGMRWNTAAPSKNSSGALLSPFKMPNQPARPGNKRLASQTLGPDMQKRQSISLTEDDMNGGANLLDASAIHVAGLFAPQPVMQPAQLPGRRASVPTWLPESTPGNLSYIPMNGINGGAYANEPFISERSAVDHSPAVATTFYPDLTPTLFGPQGFNFNQTMDLTTPTLERISFDTPVDKAKPSAPWPIQA